MDYDTRKYFLLMQTQDNVVFFFTLVNSPKARQKLVEPQQNPTWKIIECIKWHHHHWEYTVSKFSAFCQEMLHVVNNEHE